MKKSIVLWVVIIVMLGTSLAYAAAPLNWCTEWPEDTYIAPAFWYKEGTVIKGCDNPSLTLKTWAFVWGWSKIQVENSEFFWEIYKYPYKTGGILEADLTWLGVSSNSGGTLTFDWDEYLVWDKTLWTDEAGNIYYDPNLQNVDPNKMKIPVEYYLVKKVFVPDETTTDPNDGTWEETGDPIAIEDMVGIVFDPCCYVFDLYQRIFIDSKQLKGVYYGELTAEFKVTCYNAQHNDPFKPPTWPTGWVQGVAIDTPPEPPI